MEERDTGKYYKHSGGGGQIRIPTPLRKLIETELGWTHGDKIIITVIKNEETKKTRLEIEKL